MANIIRISGGGTDIAIEEVGRINGSGTITTDLTKYVGLCLAQGWEGYFNFNIMTFMKMADFKSGKVPFRSCDGTNNGGTYYAAATYVDDTQVKISSTSSRVGAILYGIFIE